MTLFASGDSITAAKLVPCAHEGAAARRRRSRDPIPYYMLMLERVRQRADDFDILHFHIDQFQFPLFRPMAQPHGHHAARPAGPARSLPLYLGFRRHAAGLDLQRAAAPDAEREFCGDRLSRPPRRPASSADARPRGDYLAFLGRISPEKRPDRAITIARALGIPLKIAAKVDKVDDDYFRTTIEPLLDGPGVEFIGEIDEQQKTQFLGEAHGAAVSRSTGRSRSASSMIEAMACGTPVLAFRCGSVPEIVDDGVTGAIVETMEEAIAALPRVMALDREQGAAALRAALFRHAHGARIMSRSIVRCSQSATPLARARDTARSPCLNGKDAMQPEATIA